MQPLSRRSDLQLLAATAMSTAAPRRVHAKADPDIIVVGAGLSGLYAAFLLEEQGANVLVVPSKYFIRLERVMDRGKPEGDEVLFPNSALYSGFGPQVESLSLPKT